MTTPVFVANTNPYPWPYDGQLESSMVALVICGAQRDLVGASTAAPSVYEVLDGIATAVRRGGGLVVWVRHGTTLGSARPTASLPRRGSSGWALVTEPHIGDAVIDASGWDGCYGSELDHALRHMPGRRVVLGGFASEITVDSTVRTLNDRGHECLVVTDACAPLDSTLGARAHHSLTMSGGIFGALGNGAALLAALEPPPKLTPEPLAKLTSDSVPTLESEPIS